MTGPIEQGGETARALIASMKDSPITLALVVFNLIFVGAVFLGTRANRAAIDRITTTLLAEQSRMTEMLYRCSPDQPERNP
jgi:hypothetical protein